MHADNQKIIETAQSYIGAPYRHQGRSKTTGVDCAGLIICIAHDLGISRFDTVAYSRRPNPTEFTNAMIKGGCKEIRFDKKQNGDIIRLAQEGWSVHTAIYEIDKQGLEWITHAWLPAKKVIRERLTEKRRQQITTVWRYPEKK